MSLISVHRLSFQKVSANFTERRPTPTAVTAVISQWNKKTALLDAAEALDISDAVLAKVNELYAADKTAETTASKE